MLMGKYHNVHKVTSKQKSIIKEQYNLKKMKNPLLYLDMIENIILKSDLQSVFEILKKAIVVEGSDN